MCHMFLPSNLPGLLSSDGMLEFRYHGKSFGEFLKILRDFELQCLIDAMPIDECRPSLKTFEGISSDGLHHCRTEFRRARSAFDGGKIGTGVPNGIRFVFCDLGKSLCVRRDAQPQPALFFNGRILNIQTRFGTCSRRIILRFPICAETDRIEFRISSFD